MTKQEEMLNKLSDALSVKIIEHFEGIDKFENKFILNSKIVKDSPFENNSFCSEIAVFIDKSISFLEIIMGETQEVSFRATARIASTSNIPKRGKELNNWSSTIFSFTIYAEISMDEERKEIIVSNFFLS